MNLSLTLNFNTIAELEAFLASRSAPAAANVASMQPAAATVQPAAAVADPVLQGTLMPAMPGAQPAVVAPIIDPMAGITQPAATVATLDPAALKAALIDKMRALAGTLPDPASVGQFIQACGLVKFSDIPDDQLVAFQAALLAKFGV